MVTAASPLNTSPLSREVNLDPYDIVDIIYLMTGHGDIEVVFTEHRVYSSSVLGLGF